MVEAFLDEMRREFPSMRVIRKGDSWLCRAISALLAGVTLGGMRHFMRYYNVIGTRLYVPDDWLRQDPLTVVIVLRHERVHFRQARRLGMPLMAFLYLIPWLPMGLAYGRARLEWEAFRETLAATCELRGREALLDPRLRRQIVEQFTGPSYGWMWPFPRQVEAWYDRAVAELLAL